jgi:hypothetical protein
MPRYFLDLPEDESPRPWDPRSGSRPERADTRYFAAVFREMERTLSFREIDVYLTWDVDRLPAYGGRVVAVVLGDEAGRIPRYVGRVRTVFKAYGTRPTLGARPFRDLRLTRVLELGQYTVRWLRWAPGGAAYARLMIGRRLRRRPLPPSVTTIPVGTFNQLRLPVVPIEDRPTDLFFAGSVEHGSSLRARVGSPKARARREMLAAVERLRRQRPSLRIDLRLTPGFGASAAAPSAAYSAGLMDAKICLAPRGTSLETFRVLEGLRYGCVVVAERLPPHWFYADGPILQLDRWSDLIDVIGPVLDDPVELRHHHHRALSWWSQRCSEEAVGRFLAERLNMLR